MVINHHTQTFSIHNENLAEKWFVFVEKNPLAQNQSMVKRNFVKILTFFWFYLKRFFHTFSFTYGSKVI